jgi:uncharacterized coiled-coil DUF342 family protein
LSRDTIKKELDAAQAQRAALDQQAKELTAQIQQGNADLADLGGKVQGARQQLAEVEAKIKAQQPAATPAAQPQSTDAPK